MTAAAAIGVALINVGAFASPVLALIGVVLFAPVGYQALAGLAE